MLLLLLLVCRSGCTRFECTADAIVCSWAGQLAHEQRNCKRTAALEASMRRLGLSFYSGCQSNPTFTKASAKRLATFSPSL
jgi:hypothetical protein